MKLWNVAKLDKEEAVEIATNYDIPHILAILLQTRGITDYDEIQNLIGETEFQESPFDIVDVDLAVDRIHEAVEKFERIAVYGDYDADGVTATSLLYSYLENIGANVMFYIPKREGEGYGMNKSAVKTLHENEVNLIITVDNGIASIEEVDYAVELGIDVIITDHHQPKDILPNALAVIDPHRKDCTSEFKGYCGAGLVLKLVMALEWDDGDPDQAFLDYVDLAAIGTVADLVPLTDENRVIVKKGIEIMLQTERTGIKVLLEKANIKEVKSRDIAFGIGPRINAVGRMGSPDSAVRLLVSNDYQEALAYADILCAENEKRKNIQEYIFELAVELIENDDKLKYSRVLVVAQEDWHPGVIGIVASKLVERYQKPAIVISLNEEGLGVGSGRSYKGFSLYDCISACSDSLIRFGGHPAAAGLKINADDIDGFREDIEQYAKKYFNIMPSDTLDIDCKLMPKSLSLDIPYQSQLLEPFGFGNESPVFGLYGMRLEKVTAVGDGKHQRLMFSRDNVKVNCMYFGCENFPYKVGALLDLAVTLEINHYNGNENLSIALKDMKANKLKQEDQIYAYNLYEKYKRKESLSKYEHEFISPVRDDMAAIYRNIRSNQKWDKGIFQLLCEMPDKGKMNIAKLLITLDAMEETKLIKITKGEILAIELLQTNAKVDIMSSNTMKTLASLLKE